MLAFLGEGVGVGVGGNLYGLLWWSGEGLVWILGFDVKEGAVLLILRRPGGCDGAASRLVDEGVCDRLCHLSFWCGGFVDCRILWRWLCVASG